MSSSGQPDVSVLIAAHNAEETLARAIRSACAEPETCEVLVIDDASTDATLDIARAEAARDDRVRPLRQKINSGPAAARNRGLGEARGSYAAVLDSDDFFLPGRLSMLLAEAPAELIADNILFTNAETADHVAETRRVGAATRFERLSTEDFIRGNLQKRGRARGELGFLKPLLSLEFLRAHNLTYDETLRLAEDFDLYLRMLMAGGRLKLTRAPGYGAVVRPGSLSARHRTQDLEQLHDALEGHLYRREHLEPVRAAMRTYLREVRRKRDHRRFLDLKRRDGIGAALHYAAASPGRFGSIAGRIARDKLGLSATAGDALRADGTRMLLEEQTSAGSG